MFCFKFYEYKGYGKQLCDVSYYCSLNIKFLDYKVNAIFQRHELTLQLIFFDGEEAIKEWRGSDNTYGARDLANKWNRLNYTRYQNENHI